MSDIGVTHEQRMNAIQDLNDQKFMKEFLEYMQQEEILHPLRTKAIEDERLRRQEADKEFERRFSLKESKLASLFQVSLALTKVLNDN